MAGPDPRRVPGSPGKLPAVPPLAPPQGGVPPVPGQPVPPQQFPAQYPQAPGQPMPGQMPGAMPQYPQAPQVGGQYPTMPYPQGAAPQGYPQVPFGNVAYPAAPQYPGSPQFPGAPMPAAPQFPMPAQYQGGFAPPPAAAPPTYPGAYPSVPQYPAAPQFPQMSGAPQPGGLAYPASPQAPGMPQYPNTFPTAYPQMPGATQYPTAPPPPPAPPTQRRVPAPPPAAPAKPSAGAPQSKAAKISGQQRPGGAPPGAVFPGATSANSAAPVDLRALPGRAPQPGTSSLPEEEGVTVGELARKHAIPLLVSFIVHLGIVIFLGLISFPEIKQERMIIQASVEQPVDSSFGEIHSLSASMDAVELESFRPLARLPQLPTAVNVPIVPMGIGVTTTDLVSPSDLLPSALAGRGMKGKLLGEKGGTIQTEEAVESGLAWLAAHQLPNGFWSLTGTAQGGKGKYTKGADFENQEAATAMALLAFFGAGHTPKNNSPHAKVIDKAVKALIRGQDAKGNLFHGSQKDDLLYTQALCTMALCEYLALDPTNAELKAPCEKAVKFCLETQSDSGGWKYTPRLDSDTSVTGWMLMALQSAKNARVEVPQDAFYKITAYLDAVAKGPDMVNVRTSIVTLNTPGIKPAPGGPPEGSRYGYMIGDNFDHVMTAEGLLCRMYLGWGPNDERLRNGCDYLIAEKPPIWDERDVYYWYYGTQLMFHMEGTYWDAWNRTLRDLLVAKQEKAGAEKGSWNPMGTGKDEEVGADTWSLVKRGGRLYVTCFSIYMLEVYYRHLPLYSELKKQMEARHADIPKPE